jgi:FKBP-type peptidyl-prolyl cis-trans isomerase SlyD
VTIKVPDKGEGTVVDIIGNRVLIDFNHPFAGKELHYRFRIESLVTDTEEKVKGLIRLYAGRDMDTSFTEGTLTISLPPGINYDRRWVLWRSRIVHESLDLIPDIERITLVETFTRQEKEGA